MRESIYSKLANREDDSFDKYAGLLLEANWFSNKWMKQSDSDNLSVALINFKNDMVDSSKNKQNHSHGTLNNFRSKICHRRYKPIENMYNFQIPLQERVPEKIKPKTSMKILREKGHPHKK